MSRTPVRPDPEVARAVGAVLFGGLLMAHVLTLPHGFEMQSYLGVMIILSCLIAWSGAVWMMIENRGRVWWYALADGAATSLAWLLTQIFGLPVTEKPFARGWLNREGLLLLFFAVNLMMLACWVLWTRERALRTPVVSARERSRRLH